MKKIFCVRSTPFIALDYTKQIANFVVNHDGVVQPGQMAGRAGERAQAVESCQMPEDSLLRKLFRKKALQTQSNA